MSSSAQLKLGTSHPLVRILNWAYKDSLSLENKVSWVAGLLNQVGVRLTKLSWETKVVSFKL